MEPIAVRRALWAGHVQSWRNGALTKAAYCRGHALSPKTFAAWIKRCNPKPAADLALTLAPLAVGPPVAAGELLLRHANGWQLIAQPLPPRRRNTYPKPVPRARALAGSLCPSICRASFTITRLKKVVGLDAYEAKIDVTVCIVGFYNCERLNSVLGNLPPAVFERNMAAKKPIVASEIS